MSDIPKIYPLRLQPDQDLKNALIEFTLAENIKAGYIITCVGSLQQACIRFAGLNTADIFRQKFEILSLSGTLCPDGVHLHIALADSNGRVIGGHLVNGNIIFTTAEIVIGTVPGITFARLDDAASGFKELVVFQK